jgi:hypothetical protein
VGEIRRHKHGLIVLVLLLAATIAVGYVPPGDLGAGESEARGEDPPMDTTCARLRDRPREFEMINDK